MGRFDMPKKKTARNIRRSCVVCGKKMKIHVKPSGYYSPGHYFGVTKVPIKGTGKYVRTGTAKFGKRTVGITKWTGKNKDVEYWECEKCYLDED